MQGTVCARMIGFALGLTGALASSIASGEVLVGLAAPLTGPQAWGGAATQQGAALAAADLNAAGGVLGEQIEIITVDDFCTADQAVAAAQKLVEAKVKAAFGHECSGAAIPASRIYASANVLMISTFATNPELTEQGFNNVFRVVGRDDVQGRKAARLLAERFGSGQIGIVHDGQAYGRGLADETRRGLAERGIEPALQKVIEPGRTDYSELVRELQKSGVEVLYYGGYPSEPALILRQAHDRGYRLQLVAGDGIGTQDFGMIAGRARAGTLFTFPPEPPSSVKALGIFKQLGPEVDRQSALAAHAALEVWAQAVEIAGSFGTAEVAAVLRAGQFETALGTVGFDAKGDLLGPESFIWYVWEEEGYVPLEQAVVTE